MEQGGRAGTPEDDHPERQPSIEGDVAEGEIVNELVPIVLAHVQQNLHLPMELPDGERLAELKRLDPEAHQLFLRETKAQLEHQRFMEAARYNMPMKTIRGAQNSALAALGIIAAVACYALYLGYPWLAGVLAAFDILGIVTVFLRSGSRGHDDEDEPPGGA